MKSIIIAPHPDDEVLGAGGTLLRRKSMGGETAWVIVTSMNANDSWPSAKILNRSLEIRKIAKFFQFDCVYELNFPSTKLDQVPMSTLVKKMSEVFDEFMPQEVFLPHAGDVHTDHQIVFQAASSCVKCFRHPYIRRILAYETLSETDFNLNQSELFRPNFFVNIESYLGQKLQALQIYASEISTPPFPRSCDAIEALAVMRGAASGFRYAEAFELLRESV